MHRGRIHAGSRAARNGRYGVTGVRRRRPYGAVIAILRCATSTSIGDNRDAQNLNDRMIGRQESQVTSPIPPDMHPLRQRASLGVTGLSSGTPAHSGQEERS